MPREFICIVCPKGCHITVHDNGDVTGNTCIRGKNYVLQEMSHPTRMITSTVSVINGLEARASVVTSSPIPKEKIFEVMEEIHKTSVEAPVKMKQVIIKDVLGLGVDIIASKEVEAK